MIPRPKRHLIDAGKRWPHAWKLVDNVRDNRGRKFPDWPDWCFMPMAGAHGILLAEDVKISHELGDIQVGVLAALAAWRPTQGIYRFHPELLEAVWNTSVEGNLPTELFYRLPEWCVYIETPGKTFGVHDMYGFFVHLEYDPNDGRSELRLLVDVARDETPLPFPLIPISLHLVSGGIPESIDAFLAHVEGMIAGLDEEHEKLDLVRSERDLMIESVRPLVSLTLYLCSTAAEYRTADGRQAPSKPRPKKTKRGTRYFPPHEPTVWETGFRIGEALRQAHSSDTQDTGATVRPHIRRAHWHTYWLGPRSNPEKRRAELRWLPPIPVNIDQETEMKATIRHVREG